MTPPSEAVSKSKRIWPLIASIFCPPTCTAIFLPSDTMRNSESGCLIQSSFLRRDAIARPIWRGWMRFSRSLMRVWMVMRSENE